LALGETQVDNTEAMTKLKPGEYEIEGVVLEALPSMTYRVSITTGPENLVGKEILAKISGQMKMFKIKVMPGDGVKVLMTQYDDKRGRITFRSKEVKPLAQTPVATQITATDDQIVVEE
jgi:translation initiation factor IF-1